MPCVLGCHEQVADRTRRIVALLEVHGQLRRNVSDPGPVDRLAAVADTPVNLCPPHGWQQAIRHLEIENVAELVARRDCSIRQLDQARGSQELMSAHQRLAALLYP